MFRHLTPLGSAAKKALEHAIAATGCREESISLKMFLRKLEVAKQGPDLLQVTITDLLGGSFFLKYQDGRVTPVLEGHRLFTVLSSRNHPRIKIEWNPVLSGGEFWLEPALDLPFQTNGYYDSGGHTSLRQLILEFLGYKAVKLDIASSGYLISGQIKAVELHQMTDSYGSTSAVASIDEAICWVEDYLKALRALKEKDNTSLISD